jgi:hypothetical protein
MERLAGAQALTSRSERPIHLPQNLSTKSAFRFRLSAMAASKDNIKAFLIIGFYLILLVGLLAAANHFRPHP